MAARSCGAMSGTVSCSPEKNGLMAYSANVRATIAAVTGRRTRNVTQRIRNAGNGPNASAIQNKTLSFLSFVKEFDTSGMRLIKSLVSSSSSLLFVQCDHCE